MHGAHGLFRKGWPYEESVRVPLLVRLPDSSGRTCDEAISLLDLPQLIENFLDCGDWPKIEAEFASISMPSVVRLAHQCDRKWHGLRSKTRKQIFNEDGSLWLDFDLVNDPDETINRA
jgi:arylsulfatase A-like enzyme